MLDDLGPGLARRRFPRRIFQRTVSLLSAGQYFVGRGHEIGEGGMLLEFKVEDKLLAEGDIILVNFMLPVTGICIVRAEVRSVRKGDDTCFYGLLFLNLSYEGKKGIREYIAEKSEEESKQEQNLLSQKQPH